MYLLIKQSPEHRQRDVEHQNPQHHLNLLDQTLLLTHKRTGLTNCRCSETTNTLTFCAIPQKRLSDKYE